MKSFLTFILEGPKDPVSFAQRYAQRARGMGKSYEGEELLHIPTPNYDEKRAGEAEMALSRFEDRIIGQEDFKSGMQRVMDMHTDTTIPINQLKPIQPTVEVEDPEILRNKIESKNPYIRVIRHRGEHFVVDGHHEILGAMLRGEKEVPVKLLDIGGVPRK